jgi:hypothetical protein
MGRPLEHLPLDFRYLEEASTASDEIEIIAEMRDDELFKIRKFV